MKIVFVLLLFFFSTSVFAIDISAYVCTFATPLQKVDAKEWGFVLKGAQTGGKACTAKIFCEWNYNERLLPAAWNEKNPPRFEGVTACSVDKDGNCSKTFQECNDDQGVGFEFSEEKNSFRDKKLGVRPNKYFLNGGAK